MESYTYFVTHDLQDPTTFTRSLTWVGLVAKERADEGRVVAHALREVEVGGQREALRRAGHERVRLEVAAPEEGAVRHGVRAAVRPLAGSACPRVLISFLG